MRLALRCILVVVLVGTLGWPGRIALGAEDESARIERLASVCVLWSAVELFHPFLSYQEIDWDAVLVAAIPKVNAATSAEEYEAAIQSMLDSLHDPVTRVVTKTRPATPAASGAISSLWRTPCGRMGSWL